MVYVDYKGENGYQKSLSYEDNRLVRVDNRDFLSEEDYGDEACTKMVTRIGTCNIFIDASIADDFKDISEITFVRYNYYSPAYSINYTHCEKEYLEDGGIVYHYVREK